jgi:hypothetical protein
LARLERWLVRFVGFQRRLQRKLGQLGWFVRKLGFQRRIEQLGWQLGPSSSSPRMAFLGRLVRLVGFQRRRLVRQLGFQRRIEQLGRLQQQRRIERRWLLLQPSRRSGSR